VIRDLTGRLLLALALTALIAASAGAQQQFLALSDVHFDPMADAALVDRLAAAAPEKWAAILDGAADRRVVGYGRDTNWPLLRSALQQMQASLPHPAFILVSGDFLAHDYRRRFERAAQAHGGDAYRRFVVDTFRFIALQLRRHFPGVPILPTLGNNDAVCGDYRIEPNGPFLSEVQPILKDLVKVGLEKGFAQDWQRLGNYRVTLPGAGGIELISLNSVYFSPRYENACGRRGAANPAAATLDWLAAQLDRAAAAHRRVWLLYHIPPGIDAFASLRRGSCPAHFVSMWRPEDIARFETLLRRRAGTIVAAFAGHTHTDDIRLFAGDGFALITPAVSPIFGQNPGFRIVSFDDAGGIRDTAIYDLANLATAASGEAAPEWQEEYRFTSFWGVPRVDRASLARLYDEIGKDAAAHERWARLFAVSSPGFWHAGTLPAAVIARAQRAEYCAAGHLDTASYGQCYCPD
jgi:sphingomyelin phosphodiesterase acid-like 3